MKTDGLDAMYVAAGKIVLSRIIDVLENLGISPVCLVIGDQGEIIEKYFHDRNVRIAVNSGYEHDCMIESVKLGIRKIGNECRRVLIMRTDIPAFSADTVSRLLRSEEELVRPLYEGIPGSPVLIGSEYFDILLSYEGNEGMRGAFKEHGIGFSDIPVDDPGVIASSKDPDCFKQIEELISKEQNGRGPINVSLDINLGKNYTFFNNESALLFEMIDATHSIKTACECIHISYSKAWTMIRNIEKQTGIKFVIKKIGGFKGGTTVMTEEGREFIKNYREMMDELSKTTEEMFRNRFL